MPISSMLRKRSPLAAFKGALILSALMVIGIYVFTAVHLLPDPEESLSNPYDFNAESRRDLDPCKALNTWRDIQNCVPSNRLRPMSANCTTPEISTWEDAQRCLTGRFVPKEERATERPFNIQIVGERHSGTKWITTEMQNCFDGAPESVPFIQKIERDFIRSKHFFQPLRYGGNFRHIIMVVIVRNPLDWVMAMNKLPYHSPNHVANMTSDEITPLPWTEFVSRPWTMPRPKSDEDLMKRMEIEAWLKTKGLCQTNFHFEEVIPCRIKTILKDIPSGMRRAMFPVYELKRDGSGEAYRNILELRADKIGNHVLQLSLLVPLGGFVLVRYEDLLERGTQYLLEQVAEIAGLPGGLPRQCKPATPQPERLQQRPVPPGLEEWIDANINVHSEQLLGYR